MPYAAINGVLEQDVKAGFRRSMKGSAFMAPLDYEFSTRVLEDFANLVKRIPDAAISIVVFEFTPYKKIIRVPQRGTAFANRGAYGNMLWIMGCKAYSHINLLLFLHESQELGSYLESWHDSFVPLTTLKTAPKLSIFV